MTQGIPPTGIRNLFRRMRSLSGHNQRLLLEACGELVRAWFLVRWRPFRVVAAGLGEQGVLAPPEAVGRAAEVAGLAWAIQAVGRRTPWVSTCLMQALAAQRMLRRRNIPATVYLAMLAGGRKTSDPLLAHAWVRCGDRVITGQCDESQYRVIATFA